jgi:adenylylsulfate kinase
LEVRGRGPGGDVNRTHLSQGLGFARPDRETNLRRIGFLCRMLIRHRVIVVKTDRQTPEESRRIILKALERSGFL